MTATVSAHDRKATNDEANGDRRQDEVQPAVELEVVPIEAEALECGLKIGRQKIRGRDVGDRFQQHRDHIEKDDAEDGFSDQTGDQQAVERADDALLNEIGDALLEAGWKREDISGATEHGVSYPDGVTVLFSTLDRSAPPSLAIALANVLGEIGLSSSQPLALDESLVTGEVKIAMGFKPGRNGED